MREIPIVVGRLLIVALLCAIVVGCGGGAARRVSMNNYEKIKVGMTEAEVEAILGKGEEQASSSVDIPGQSINAPGGENISIAGISSSSKMVNWEDEFKVITIMFSDGKVMSKGQFGL